MLRGGCQCGRVRYESDATPFNATLCTCIDCRRATGTPLVAWFTVPRASLRITGAPKRHESSPGVMRGFCADCGTPLLYEAAAQADETDITTASLDTPEQVPPQDHVWTRDRIAWLHLAPGLPEYGRGRRDG